MASSIALVVIVASGQARDPSTLALAEAARATAGAQVIVEDAAPATESEALAFAARDHADAVAVITWDPDRARATVHLHRAGEARWLDRAVGFQPADVPAERGRTVGFAIASMLPEPFVAEEPPPPAAPPLVPLQPPRDQLGPAGPRRWRGAVDASGQGSVALGGYGGGVGAQLAGHWYFLPRLSARAGFALRSGQIPPAQGTSLTLTTALGLGFRWLEPSPKLPLEVGGRVSMLVIHQSISHLSADDANAAVQSRWLPGAELMLEGAYYFVENAGVVIGAGTEVALGETSIVVARRPIASLVPWHLSGEIGLRARF